MIKTTIFVTQSVPLENFDQVGIWMSETEAMKLIAKIANAMQQGNHGDGPGHIAVIFSGIVLEGDKLSGPLQASLGVLAL